MTDPGCLPCSRLSVAATVPHPIRPPKSSLESEKSLEDWLYSVIIAAALVALVLGFLGQLNTPYSEAQLPVSQSSTIDRSLPTQGKDGRF